MTLPTSLGRFGRDLICFVQVGKVVCSEKRFFCIEREEEGPRTKAAAYSIP